MPGIEKVGVEAVAEGVTRFLTNMRKMEGAYDRFTGGIGKGTQAMQGAGAAASGLAAKGMVALGAAVAAVAVAFGVGLVVAITKATRAMIAFTWEGMKLAGHFQEMEFAAPDFVGLAVGQLGGWIS